MTYPDGNWSKLIHAYTWARRRGLEAQGACEKRYLTTNRVMDITYPRTNNCVSDFKLEERSTQPADTCGACPTPGKPAGPDRLRWFVAHLVPRGDRVVTRPQSSADFPLSFFRRQSGRWCMGGLAWWSAKGSERGDAAWSIE